MITGQGQRRVNAAAVCSADKPQNSRLHKTSDSLRARQAVISTSSIDQSAMESQCFTANRESKHRIEGTPGERAQASQGSV